MPDYIDRTLRAYDLHPEKYEAATANMVPTEEIEAFIKYLPSGNHIILDAGCAFGRDTAILAQHGRKVIGVDMSTALLKRARQLHPELTFKKMDVRKLELDDESVAGIWCNATLLHLNNEDILRALKEFRRVLIAGGVACLSFKEGTGEEEFVENFSSESARYFNYQTESTLKPMFEKAGLTIIKIYVFNEREQYGPDKRDLNWIKCFVTKPED